MVNRLSIVSFAHWPKQELSTVLKRIARIKSQIFSMRLAMGFVSCAGLEFSSTQRIRQIGIKCLCYTA